VRAPPLGDLPQPRDELGVGEVAGEGLRGLAGKGRDDGVEVGLVLVLVRLLFLEEASSSDDVGLGGLEREKKEEEVRGK
jgi:hypothetical protein